MPDTEQARIVLDTNVVVSGLLTPHGPPAAVLGLVLAGDVALGLDSRILAEYREVLARPKFGFDAERVAILLEFIRGSGYAVNAGRVSVSLPDPDDAMFLEVAIAWGPGVDLITGNLRHYPPDTRGSANVVAPADWLAHWHSLP